MRQDEVRGYGTIINKNGTFSYIVKIQYNYKKIYIGVFNCEKKAKKIYEKARTLVESGIYDPTELKIKIALIFPEEDILRMTKFGMPGVVQSHNKFTARITINKKRRIIGHFYTPEEAHLAYLKAKNGVEVEA